MMQMFSPKFVLDSNVFITAKNSYYAFDICPSFWATLTDASRGGQIASIDQVQEELRAGNDDLAEWVRDEGSGMFAPSTAPLVASIFSRMVDWVQQNQQFTPAAKAEFASSADGWVAAFARVHDATVVTLEVYDPNVRARVKLPNVCRQFGVEYLDTFHLLRRLGVSF